MQERDVATYYVLYRLTQQGLEASAVGGGQADLMACTSDGRRVVLLRVRTCAASGRYEMIASDRLPTGRNVAYAFVDFEPGRAEPSVFVLRGAQVTALLERDPSWPRDRADVRAFETNREAWHLLGLSRRSSAVSTGAVSSSPVA